MSRSAANKVTLDISAIEAVRQLDPNDEDRLLARLIALYRDDSSQLLADMENGLKVGDAESVARAAHTLKIFEREPRRHQCRRDRAAHRDLGAQRRHLRSARPR